MKGILGRLVATLAVAASVVSAGPPAAARADSPGYYLAVWGATGAGPLGTTACCSARSVPTGVPGTGKVIAAVPANIGVVAAASDGTVWAWGPYGPQSGIPSLLPKRVPGLSGVTALAAGGQFVLALTSDGRVWSWGSGAIGRSATTLAQAQTPAPIPGLTGVVKIAATGNNALAITSDGSLYSWGDNFAGQIGDGTRIQRYSPVLVSTLSHVISAGTSSQNAVAVESDGSVWAWGDDALGVPVRPGIVQSTVPVRVSGVSASTAAVAGFSTGLALTRDGAVWAWGENSGDALHTGHPSQGINGSAPAPVIGLSNVTAIASGANRYMAIEGDGSVWTWAGGLGGPARQPGLHGAAAIAANAEVWLALASSPPPAPPKRPLKACTRTVRGNLVVGGLLSTLYVDQQTGHVFVVDDPWYSLSGSSGPICTEAVHTLDGRTGRVLRTVRIGKGTSTFSLSAIGGYISGPILGQDGNRLFVAYQPSLTSQDTSGGVSVVDTRTGSLLRSIPVGYSMSGLAAGDGTSRAYLSYMADTAVHDQGVLVSSLAFVSGAGGTVRAEKAPLTGAPVLDPRARRLFILGETSSTAVDTRSGAVVRTVSYTGGSLAGAGLAGHSGRLYVAYGVSPHCCGPSLQLLDSRSGKRIAQLGTAGQYGPVIVDAPAGRVLVARYGFSAPVKGVTEIREASTGRLLRTLPYLIGPGVVDNRNGFVYSITAPNTVTVLNPKGWRVVARYHPGATLTAIALDQRTNRAFVLSRSGQGVGATQTVHSFCVARHCT